MYCKSIIITLLVLFSVGQCTAQKRVKTYRWKHLGPHIIAPSNVDSGDWSAVGQGWIEDLCITPYGWYAGAITGGLYYSKNEAKRWRKIDKDSIQLGTLCILQVGDTLYRGTGLTHYDEKFGFGILQSRDKGRTWHRTGLTFKATDKQPIWALAYAPKTEILVACSHNSIYISRDKAVTWDKVHSDESYNLRSVTINPTFPETILVSGKELLVSRDGGLTWNNVTQDLSIGETPTQQSEMMRVALCVDPNAENRILAYYGQRYGSRIDESLDGGKSWQLLAEHKSIGRADIHHTEIVIAPGNSDYILIGNFRAFLSKNNGQSFEAVTFPVPHAPQFAHDDIRGVQMISAAEYFLATDGGVFRTTDTARTWQNVSGKGLTAMQVYGMTQVGKDSILLGTQDMGYFLADGKKWSHLGAYYGDGGDALKLRDKTYILLGASLRTIDLTKQKGYDYVHPSAQSGTFLSRLIPEPNSDSSFYYIDFACWHFTGKKWENLTASLEGTPYKMLGMDVNLTNPSQLWVGYDQPTWDLLAMKNKLFKSMDGGITWHDYTSNLGILAWRNITDICTKDSNPDEVYVSLGMNDGEAVHKVYKSSDGGLTWQNYSQGLPFHETFIIRQIPNSSGMIVSTLAGLYYRNNNMEEWQHLGGKIPPIAIRDFEIDLKKRYLYAATYGNGLWRMKIPRKLRRD
jgi:photosystem II stability/assembly factor-like uncharacterized protein